jgi:DNA-binding helix-hairpin-helix protein with protein kinase domain
MEKPPGTPNLEIVGGEVARLFEQAFSLDSSGGNRPSARTWVQALTNLENQLKQCTSVPWHWHLAALRNCPWCSMETALGVSLFPAIQTADETGTFSIDRFWQSVSAVQHPGPLPTFSPHVATPSAKVIKLKENLNNRHIIAWSVCLASVVFITAVSHGVLIFPALCVGGFMLWPTRSLFGKPAEVQEIRTAYSKAENDWNNAMAIWTERAAPKAFDIKKAELDRAVSCPRESSHLTQWSPGEQQNIRSPNLRSPSQIF